MSATASQPLMLRLLSASACAANRAGGIIRDVLKSGKLGVVEKVLDIGFLGRIMRYVSMFFIGGFTNFFFIVKCNSVVRVVCMCMSRRDTMTHRRRQTGGHSDALWRH